MTVLNLFTLTVFVLLCGCASRPAESPESGMSRTALKFVDLAAFDEALANSLSTATPRVSVGFYDQVMPSKLPERLQAWLAAVEKGGGKITVTPPKSAVVDRSPFLVLSALSSLWAAAKMARELALQQQFRPAHGYDAELVLQRDEKGQTLLDEVVFVQRPR